MGRWFEDNTAAILMSDEPSSQEWSPEMQWGVTSNREDSGDDILQAPQFGRDPAVSTFDRQHHAPEASNTLKEQAEGLQKQLAEFKEVEVLVNAAGTNAPKRALEVLSMEDYHAMIDTNLHGAYYCVQAFLPHGCHSARCS